MESERFDRLVWTFGEARSRRQALLGLAGAAAAVLALSGRDASARCKGEGAGCKNSHQCCSNLFCRREAGSPKSASGICTAIGTEICVNGVDDDGDGLVDCNDPACVNDPACQIGPEICSNGVDDDHDGLIDGADPDC